MGTMRIGSIRHAVCAGGWRRAIGLALSFGLPLGAAALSTGCDSPRPVATSRSLGEWNFEYGRYAEAAEYYGEIIARYPGDADAQYHYGVCQSELGDLNAARRSLEAATKLRPNDDQVAFALADVLARQGDLTQLYQLLRDRAAATGRPEAWVLMSQYALEHGDPDTARTAALNAIEVDDGRSAEPYYQAALVAEMLGETDNAVRRLRQGYGINPDDQRIRTKLVEYGEVLGPTLALPPGR
ncbi:MAG: tetratricopeptide repeat protein [Phycisphaerales bacterium]|nr:tetratricopeptide repeat protein [Phycisphaerales bacterium]